MSMQSVGRSRFYVNWIDHVSGFRHLHFMRHKSDVYGRFQEFHATIQNKFGRSIKVLRMDNGKEYINNNMLRYLAKHGIQLETTAPHTPEQNGRSERDNRILVESARSMLHAKKLPVRLRTEAMNAAAYVLNRTPTSRTKGTTQYEMWIGKRPDLSHIRIFGSEVFAHVPKEQRSKWDKKSRKLIFVGYQRESSNYWLYDPHSGKIIVSRDVDFNESQDEQTSLIDCGMSLPLENDSRQKDQTAIEDMRSAERSARDSDNKHPEEEIHQENEEQNHRLRDRSKKTRQI